MLDKQYHMYSVDTGHFYSSRERYYHDKNRRYRQERRYLQNKLPDLEKKLRDLGLTEEDMKHLKKGRTEEILITEASREAISEYVHWIHLIQHKREKAKDSKERLLTLLSHKAKQNELTDGRDHIRTLKQESLHENLIISVFDSALSRAIDIPQDTLTDALFVVQVYYFDMFQDLSYFGFIYQGEKYQYFTSSAGQIRKKKAVFIKESVWNRIEKTIMCGLTLEKINAKGGNNVNKHLAYLALTNSATDAWTDFPIDKSIVIEDFETNVSGTFDFVDERDYSITRKTGAVPVPHTDGAGMILPCLSGKNFMFRAPWIKGLLGVFDFRKFIEVRRCSPVIRDIYGKEHDILKEDIQIIFTKSQVKMWKYYDSWEEYQDFFKRYRCSAGICNTEEDRIKNAKLNYQMLQTLTDLTEEEMDLLTEKSAERIRNICTSRETMLELLGVTPYNTRRTPFQEAVKLYPPLLNDTYVKDMIRELKDSLLKKYRSGKLEINGKYTFLLPDFYAACEYWFEQQMQPKGLLQDKEVFCSLFRRYEKLDCLRSPHLYKEHAIRVNTAHEKYGKRAEKIREWFVTDGLYASTHDLISKLLMYDVDGDKSLVVADPDFVRIAERNMEHIVPLYYNMRKAAPTELNRKTIYAGLNAGFTHGNIGVYSNNIAKIWNSDVFVKGSPEEQQEALDVIKLLCMENNFCIDSAKTLYMPKRPEWFAPVVSKFTRAKLPAFFVYAKDKEGTSVERRSGSFVNKIYEKIPNQPIRTRRLKLGNLDYQMLMADGTMICREEVSQLYDVLNRQYHYLIHTRDENQDNLRYVACKLREEFCKTGYSEGILSDMLVEYLYGRKKRNKQVLWFCFGACVVKNLKQNLKARGEFKSTKYIQCQDCGIWFEVPAASKASRCQECSAIYQKERTKLRVQKHRKQPCNAM